MNGGRSTRCSKFVFITEATLLKGDLFFVVSDGAFKGVDAERTPRNGFRSGFIVMKEWKVVLFQVREGLCFSTF